MSQSTISHGTIVLNLTGCYLPFGVLHFLCLSTMCSIHLLQIHVSEIGQ